MFLFIDRQEEMSYLEEHYNHNNFEFFIIYGRRRIGKTELIKNFIQKKPHIYLLCNKAGTQQNISRFKKRIAEYLNEPEIATDDLEDIFSYLASKAKQKLVIVFDEFPYLVEKDNAVPSIFQVAIDEVLKNKNIMLILCGSSISMMEELLGYKNPLYGRKTGHIKLDYLNFRHLKEFYPTKSIEENIKTYAILGGVPYYLEKFNKEKTATLNAKEHILSKRGSLYEEADFLLKEEFRQPDIYKSILSAIASGASKITEISEKSKIKATDMDRYLKTLITLGIIKKEIPITEKKSKKTLYSIDDNFFDFYSLFFEPNRSAIEIGETGTVHESLEKNFNMYLGKKFEKLMRCELAAKISPFPPTRIGRWWGYHRTAEKRVVHEIDIIALREDTKQILFCECKWKENVSAKKILAELKEKSAHVQWNNETRKGYYAVFAKSFKEKTKEEIEKLKDQNIMLFDLKAIECLLEH